MNRTGLCLVSCVLAALTVAGLCGCMKRKPPKEATKSEAQETAVPVQEAKPEMPETPQPGPVEAAAAPERERNAKFEYKWFFSFGLGRNREGVARIKSLIDTAAEHGLNGMVLSSFGLDSITRWPEKDLALLEEVKVYCEEKKIELIPTGFSVGYGGGALGHDRSFAAALPVSIALVAGKGKATPAVPDENLLRNPDLELYKGDRFSDYAFHDQPGKISFADTDVVAQGETSIRFESFHHSEHGHGRIMQEVAVKPGYSYRFTFKVKTQDLEPPSSLKAMVLTEKSTVASVHPRTRSTQDWTEVSLDFINFAHEKVRIYAGVWGARSGTFWLDDFRLSEYGSLAGIVRREGTPLRLRSSDREATFVEGDDFEEVRNRRDLKHMTLTPNTAIREGERLILSCYKTPYVGHSWGRQTSLCMSNPALYAYWESQARRLHELLGFKKVLFAMDEIRNGGGCLLCRDRGISMAEIFGDCVTRTFNMMKAMDPRIEVFIWSDMLDPNHNARDNYYGVVGDFTGSWKHVPRDIIIACWYHKIRDTSLTFFSDQGFRTFGAAYYDADDLENPREWLVSLKNTKNATGIMYTSWRKKYDLLAAYGDLVSGE